MCLFSNKAKCRSSKVLAFAFMLLTYPIASMADSDVSAEKLAQNTPSGWTAVSLPSIPTITSSNTITITDAAYGASTSSSDNTSAIQAALDAVPSTGGMVVVPKGTFLCGPVTIKSKTVLHLAAGATLKLLPYGGGSDGKTSRSTGSGYYPNSNTSAPYNYDIFLGCTSGATDIIVEGEGSTSLIYGQGEQWWEYRDVLGTRPPLIRFKKGSRFLFRNFKMQNAPGVNLTLGLGGGASNFTVHDVTISNPSSVTSEATADGDSKISHNTDGIPVWGAYVNIYDCNISTGDDNVVFDSNSQYGHVWNCTFGRGHGASFGSFTEKVHDIIFDGITFTGTNCGFRIKTQRGRSGNDQSGTSSNGAVKNITCRNSTMTNVENPIVLTTHYDGEVSDPSTVSSSTITYQTPEYCDMLFQNITVTNPRTSSSFNKCNPIYIYGLPEIYIHDITFDNVNITATKGMFMAYCKNITFKNKCKITNTSSSSTYFSKQYNATVLGSYNGTANSTYDDATTSASFSIKNTATSTVSVNAGTDQSLSGYATITGGSALIHNGHASSASDMISSKGYYFGNSGGSYIKLTLNTAIKSGDVLTTTGSDGGYVSTASSTSKTDNISGNQYTFGSDFVGKTVIYICRGASKPTLTAVSVGSASSSSSSTSTSTSTSTTTTATGTETTPTQKSSNADVEGLCYTIPATYNGGQGNYSKAIKFNIRSNKLVFNVNDNYTITGFTFTGNDNYSTNGVTVSSVNVDGGSTNVLGSTKTFAKDNSESSFSVSNISAKSSITLNIASPYDSQLNGTVVFTYKYAVQPVTLASSSTTTGRNGTVTLKFNNPIAATSATATLNGKSLAADVDGTTVKFIYSGLDYGKSYKFTLASGSLKDTYGQSYNSAVNLTVNTDARTTVTKSGYDAVVSTAAELAKAIKTANNRSDKTTRYRIFCKPGTYKLPTLADYQSGTGATTKTVTVTLSDNSTKSYTYNNPTTYLEAANVSIIGADYATTIITNSIPTTTYTGKYGTASIAEGIGNGDVLCITKNATNSYFQNVTVKTAMGDAMGRDIALNDQSNKTIFKEAQLWGYQDTYVSNNSNGRFYFEGGVLRGRTDYLCGKGDVYYNKVTLQQCGTGGYLAVPSLPLKYGYIFNECYIKKETSSVTYYLGRPWGSGTPIAMFINTKVDEAPIAAGWAEMSGGWPARFAEYNTCLTTGSAVSTSSRKTTFNSTHANSPILTASEAAYYSNLTRILSGSDGWDPTEYTEQCDQPTVSISGSKLSWTSDDYASSWVVFKDGSYYANPTTNSLTLTESGSYTVRAANFMGGLGTASTAVSYTKVVSQTVTYDAYAHHSSAISASACPTDNLSGISISYGSSAWTVASSGITCGSSKYTGCVTAASGGSYNSSSKTITTGAITLKPSYDGTVALAAVVNSNKAFYVIDETAGTLITDMSVSCYYNGCSGKTLYYNTSNYKLYEESSYSTMHKLYGTVTFSVKSGHTYSIGVAGSKIGLYGFTYSTGSSAKEAFFDSSDFETTAVDKVNSSETIRVVGIYSVNGAPRSSVAPGVNILKMSDGSVRKVNIR